MGESFELLKHIYQIKQSDFVNTIDVMDDILGIKELLDKPVRQMSLGQRVKGDLVVEYYYEKSIKDVSFDKPVLMT